MALRAVLDERQLPRRRERHEPGEVREPSVEMDRRAGTRVAGVRTRSASAAPSVSVSASTSARRGRAPAMRTPASVGPQVFAGRTTSSSGPAPSARSASAMASVPLAQADDVGDAQELREGRFEGATSSPRMNQPRSSTRAIAASIAARFSR